MLRVESFGYLKDKKMLSSTSNTAFWPVVFIYRIVACQKGRKPEICTESERKENLAAKSTNTKTWRGYGTRGYYESREKRRGKLMGLGWLVLLLEIKK